MKLSKSFNIIFPISAGMIIILALTGWILGLSRFVLISVPVFAMLLLGWAVVIRNRAWIITFSILFSLSSALIIIVWGWTTLNINDKLGIAGVSFGIGWTTILIISIILWKRAYWWTVIPAGLIISLGLCFISSSLGVWDFVFYCGAGLGISMLAWGIGAKLFGLIISGSIILTMAPGIAFSWKFIGDSNAVSQTGVMLVWFGLGWALTTICSRAIREKFTWWPLIPGGVLEMVGIGLYLGGNPNLAFGFINNTLIMSLLIFGSYIFFLRMNFRK